MAATTAPDWSTGIGVAGLFDSNIFTSTSIERRLVGDLWLIASVLGRFALAGGYSTLGDVGSTVGSGGSALKVDESAELVAGAAANTGVRYVVSNTVARTSAQLTAGAFVEHSVLSYDVNAVSDRYGLSAAAGIVVDVPLVDALGLRLGTNVLEARWSTATTKISPTETASFETAGEIGSHNESISVQAVFSPSLELRVFF